MKKKILVVDDEPDFLEMIKARLEANDYEFMMVWRRKVYWMQISMIVFFLTVICQN